jgi:hypothetical protein
VTVDLAELRDVSAPEFARITGVGIHRARRLLASGEVPTAYSVGKQWRVAVQGIEEWVRTRDGRTQ